MSGILRYVNWSVVTFRRMVVLQSSGPDCLGVLASKTETVLFFESSVFTSRHGVTDEMA